MLVNGNRSEKSVVSNPITTKNLSKPSFKGHLMTKDERGNDVYYFYLPNAKENTKVELVKLRLDEDGNFHYAKSPSKELTLENGFAKLRADELIKDNESVLGYRFRLPQNPEPYLDYVKITSDGKYNIATPLYRAGHELPRQMEHLFPDSLVYDFNDEKRNHFNHLGGTLVGVIGFVPDLKKTGIKRILSTPIFGQDTVSSHGYWTSNAYQITETLGSMFDYKHLQKVLFQNGMGWIADGAFVNEGIQGIHIKDIMWFGEKSPFINWFNTSNIDNDGFHFGVLSKQPDTDRHTKIRLVNAPYEIRFKELPDGTFAEDKIVNASYDATKPTFVQLFDDRLVTKEQLDKEEVFLVYGRKNARDKHQINNYKDAVEPYSFRVSPKDVKRNYEKYKELVSAHKKIDKAKRDAVANFDALNEDDKHVVEAYRQSKNKNAHSEFNTLSEETKKAAAEYVKLTDEEVLAAKKPEFKNCLTKWTNFELVPSNKDGGVSTWVGNTDIPKKRFMISEEKFKNKDPQTKKEIAASQYQVQDDTIQIGKFWTSETARTIVGYTAQELAKEFDKTSDYKKAIENLVKIEKLPKSALDVIKETNCTSPLDNILKVEDGKRAYNLKPVSKPENVTEGLMDYPPDAIEFAPELSSIMSYPFLKNFAVDKETIGKSRYELYLSGTKDTSDDNFYKKMPERFAPLYKETDKFIADSADKGMTGQALILLKEIGAKAGFRIVNDDGELTYAGKEVYPLIAPDIAKFLYVSALNPEIEPSYENDEFGYDIKELKKTTPELLGLHLANSPEDAAQKLLDMLKQGIKKIPAKNRDSFVDFMAQKVENYDPDTVNVARLIVEKTESGLDWRIDASKDVGDWDAVETGAFSESEALNNVKEFWKNFNLGVRKFNPKAYTIGELVLDMEYDYERSPNRAPFIDKFINDTFFTTETNYMHLYTTPTSLYGVNSEDYSHENQSISQRTFTVLKNMLSGSFMDTSNFSHTFMSNHDKPRPLHCLAMDMDKFKENKASAMKDVFERAFSKGTLNGELENNQMMKFKPALQKAVDWLSEGKYIYEGRVRRFDEECFGTRPYDQNINDVFEQAQLFDPAFKDFVKREPEKIAFIKAKLLETMLSPALTKYTSSLFYLVGLPGNPTVYCGDEYGETGWETTAKNDTQNNRNRIHIERLSDNNYGFLKQYHDNLKNILNIRNQKGASALVNGTTIPLSGIEIQDVNDGSKHGAAVVYRYTDKTDAICVFHNHGYGKNPESTGRDCSAKEIKLDRFSHDKWDRGIPFKLQGETLYYDALNPSSKYKLVDDGDWMKIVKADGGDIPLGNRGIILLREYGFKGDHYLDDKNRPSFKGRSVNAHVKLANLKYNMAF